MVINFEFDKKAKFLIIIPTRKSSARLLNYDIHGPKAKTL